MRTDEPVIVLTCARSGSTLLRFILDAHPELGCPPETGVVDLCTRMGVLSMLLDGPPADERAGLGEGAAAAIRSWVAATFGSYLLRMGKDRWCEKSLGSADSAGRFLSLFPKARFICLYRHCLDVIDSTIEACPWGLEGYGLEPFAAAHPSNTVAAVADYWVTHTRAIAEFEQSYPDVCLRVRYEDLAANPEEQAQRIFGFLGEQPVPGISATCLSPGRTLFGPADHKIWWTSQISTGSVGRGQRIPVEALSPPVLALANDLLQRLGYAKISVPNSKDTPAGPDVNHAREDSRPRLQHHPADAPPPSEPALLDELEELLAAQVARRPAIAAQPAHDSEPVSFVVTATVPSMGAGEVTARSWQVHLRPGCIGPADRARPPGGWGVTGTAEAWRSVLTGQLNFGTAVRQGHLRYADARNRDARPSSRLRWDPRTTILTAVFTPACTAKPESETKHHA